MPLLHPIPALSDNYIWALHDGCQAWVVDPGQAEPVLGWLAAQRLQLAGILLTHHHGDHTGGVAALRAATAAPAWGPAHEPLPEGVQRVREGDSLALLGGRFEVLEIPGHTAGHIAWYCAGFGPEGLLFCGDTLFSIGCGRLFEGTAAQMLASLDRLAALPESTLVCCTHEYTLSNLRFARALEPHHLGLADYQRWCEQQRQAGCPTLPSRIGRERALNPFLRSREPALRQALHHLNPALAGAGPVAASHASDAPGAPPVPGAAAQAVAPAQWACDAHAFAALRRAKDGFT